MSTNKTIKWCFYNDSNRIRNGWWIALFIIMVALTRPIYPILKSHLSNAGAGPELLELIPIGLILLVSFVCLTLRKENFSHMGLAFNRRAITTFTLGMLIAALQVCGVMLAIYLCGGVNFSFNPDISVSALLIPIYLVLLTATFEELLSRGFVFQRLIDGLGIYWALLIVGVMFSVGHWDNPEMNGLTKVIASINLGLAAMVFGMAYYQTKSLFMPIGMHFAWNAVMGKVFGVGVSGFANEGLLHGEISSAPIWLTGGKFGPEASIFATVAELTVLVLLWRWKKPASTSVNSSHAPPMTTSNELS